MTNGREMSSSSSPTRWPEADLGNDSRGSMDEIASIPDLPLADCLARAGRHFDVVEIARRQIDQDSVRDYFDKSGRGYRLFHSKQGAMHVALNCDTEFTPEGYLGQVDLVAQQLADIDAPYVLEIGCGTGFNTRNLAERFPDGKFVGVDLLERHVEIARREANHLANAEYEVGDFQQLRFSNNSMDVVVAIECICQASNTRKAMHEAWRVLRPGGLLIVVDCFRATSLDRYDENLQLAARLVEKTMAVDEFAVLDDWTTDTESLGFARLQETDLSPAISHNLARFYSLARRYFKMPRAARAFLRAFPERLLENSISGLLMPFTVGAGVHRYHLCVLRRDQA